MWSSKNAVVYVVGVMCGSSGHVLFLRDWPDRMMNAELESERCAFCASRGLKHNSW
jgi:hypothetical protein